MDFKKEIETIDFKNYYTLIDDKGGEILLLNKGDKKNKQVFDSTKDSYREIYIWIMEKIIKKELNYQEKIKWTKNIEKIKENKRSYKQDIIKSILDNQTFLYEKISKIKSFKSIEVEEKKVYIDEIFDQIFILIKGGEDYVQLGTEIAYIDGAVLFFSKNDFSKEFKKKMVETWDKLFFINNRDIVDIIY